MSWITKTLTSTIGRKLVMSLTGLFLVSFLFVHLIGNFQLFYADGGLAFNKYSKFMSTAGIIRVLEIGLVAGFVLHIWQAFLLTSINKKARPVGYAYDLKPTKDVSWFSRNMGLSGSIVLVFLIMHLYNFYWAYHNDEVKHAIYLKGVPLKQVRMGLAPNEADKKEMAAMGYPAEQIPQPQALSVDSAAEHIVVSLNEKQLNDLKPKLGNVEDVYKDMYILVSEVFSQQWWYSILYLVAMLLLAFHLNHGFQSAWRTLGIEHKKYTPLLTNLGLAISILVPLGFASMPLFFMLKPFLGL